MISHPPKVFRFLRPAATYVLAAVFLASAIGKLLSPSEFYAFISSIDRLALIDPAVFVHSTAVIELIIALLLILPRTARFGGISSFGLLFLFSATLMYASQTNVTVPCGCFGQFIADGSTDLSILRNMVLLLVSALVVQGASQRFQQN